MNRTYRNKNRWLKNIEKEMKDEKKIFSYISLAALIVPSFFVPIANVQAEEQQESVEQTTSETSEKADSSDISMDSSTTPSASSDSSTENSTESTDETVTENSSNHTESTSNLKGAKVEADPAGQPSSTQPEVSMDNTQEDLSTWLPDPTLQSIVAENLGIEVSEITKEQMKKLHTIYIYDKDSAIADLTGLEYATDLSSFYMSGTNQITDFSVLGSLSNLVYVYLMGANVTDDNLPNFGENITRLNLSSANVTDAVFSKIVNMKGLESLTFESNMKITTIAPLVALPNLTDLRIQFCAVTDFTVINNFPKLSSLAAFGQNTGRNDPVTSLSAKDLNYDSDNQSFFVPFSLMPNRLTNFDGYQPPFTTSNSASQTYFDWNGVQLPSSRLTITEDGVTVTGVTQSEFENIQTMKYNARLNNPAGSYAQPNGYSFYAISSGTYLHQFSINHQEVAADVTVSYVDTQGNELKPSQKISGNIGESFDATTPEYKLEIDGYTLKEVQGDATGTFSDEPQDVVYVYERSDAAPVTVKYQDSEGNQLAEPTVLNGKIGLPYTSEAKEISGWYLETPSNVTGTFSDEPQDVVYVYERSDAAPVTVKYQDSEGNQLAEPTVLNGKIGLPYTSEAKEISGWYVAETPSNATGTFSDEPQDVIYVYERSNVAPGTAKHHDFKGDQLAESTVPSNKAGLPYTSETKTSRLESSNPQGSSSEEARPKDNNNSDKNLPKTGEHSIGQTIMTTIGALLVALAFLVLKKRKKNKQ